MKQGLWSEANMALFNRQESYKPWLDEYLLSSKKNGKTWNSPKWRFAMMGYLEYLVQILRIMKFWKFWWKFKKFNKVNLSSNITYHPQRLLGSILSFLFYFLSCCYQHSCFQDDIIYGILAVFFMVFNLSL